MIRMLQSGLIGSYQLDSSQVNHLIRNKKDNHRINNGCQVGESCNDYLKLVAVNIIIDTIVNFLGYYVVRVRSTWIADYLAALCDLDQ
jgi:hypothetical protein